MGSEEGMVDLTFNNIHVQIVQLPGWSGLANARVTIFGDVYQLPPEFQGHAKDVSPHLHCWLLLHSTLLCCRTCPPARQCLWAIGLNTRFKRMLDSMSGSMGCLLMVRTGKLLKSIR